MGSGRPRRHAQQENADLRQTFLDVYVPRYGPEWERFLDSGPVFARIEADKMFTFHMEVADQAG